MYELQVTVMCLSLSYIPVCNMFYLALLCFYDLHVAELLFLSLWVQIK